MKKFIYHIITLAATMMLVVSCTDELNQYPVIETDSKGVYSEAANYRNVLAKLYASYVIAGQELGGGNVDLTPTSTFSAVTSTFRRPERMNSLYLE